MLRRLSPLNLLALGLAILSILVYIGPTERTPGTNVRPVYLLGAWLWTALTSSIAAEVIGVLGLLTNRQQ